MPDNLRSLFRPCAVLRPDWGAIGRIMFSACGFDIRAEMSEKVITLMRLCSDQLSRQSHYDFGSRGIKAIIYKFCEVKRCCSGLSDEECMMKSLSYALSPKLIDEDVSIFRSICSELFPGASQSLEPPATALASRISLVLRNFKLQSTSYLLGKVEQIYNALCDRSGVMVVGAAMSGKTTAWQILAEALKDLQANPIDGRVEHEVYFRVINPRAVTNGQLFGERDAATGEWCDGVLPRTLREMTPMKTRTWIVFDGPIDASWIEQMHTLLDGNGKLSLSSGEMMQKSALMSFIFETGHLANVSPSTVARCGVVWMNQSTLNWEVLHASFINELAALGVSDSLVALFDGLSRWLVPGMLSILGECSALLPVSGTQQYKVRTSAPRISSRSFTYTLTTPSKQFFSQFIESSCRRQKQTQMNAVWFQQMFLFCLAWSFCSTLLRNLQLIVKNKPIKRILFCS